MSFFLATDASSALGSKTGTSGRALNSLTVDLTTGQVKLNDAGLKPILGGPQEIAGFTSLDEGKVAVFFEVLGDAQLTAQAPLDASPWALTGSEEVAVREVVPALSTQGEYATGLVSYLRKGLANHAKQALQPSAVAAVKPRTPLEIITNPANVTAVTLHQAVQAGSTLKTGIAIHADGTSMAFVADPGLPNVVAYRGDSTGWLLTPFSIPSLLSSDIIDLQAITAPTGPYYAAVLYKEGSLLIAGTDGVAGGNGKLTWYVKGLASGVQSFSLGMTVQGTLVIISQDFSANLFVDTWATQPQRLDPFWFPQIPNLLALPSQAAI